MLTKIDLCSQALLKIGENAIVGFDDDSPAARIAKAAYDAAIDNLLAGFNWHFATKKFRIAKSADGDFQIPTTVLRVLECKPSAYEITGGVIRAEGDEIEISAIARVGPDSFPPYFAQAAATRLAMEFCIPLTGNQNTFALLNALCENELRAARFIDSTTARPRAIENFSLLSSRF